MYKISINKSNVIVYRKIDIKITWDEYTVETKIGIAQH